MTQKKKATLDYLDQLANHERIRIIRIPGEFNYSKINNRVCETWKRRTFIFLNNDIEVINEGWLTEMVSHGLRKHVGCVGAKLLYPDDTIQHGGVILGLGGVAGHAFRQFPKSHTGDKNRLNLVQNYSAVTGACLLIRKKYLSK